MVSLSHAQNASIRSGCAAARTGCIKKGDLVVKVNQDLVRGFSLSQLRQLVLGAPGSVCVFTFRRETSSDTSFCYDVDLMRGSGEFLDLVERNTQQALIKEVPSPFSSRRPSCSLRVSD
jgi:hypothetical protein